MNLNGRVSRLEEAAQQQPAERCCWHGSLVIYPPTMGRDAGGQMVVPPCENPATCPGAARVQILLPERRASCRI